MAFICTECGHIFDEGEEMRWTEPHGEPMSGCPLCGSTYEETKHCKHCYGDFAEDNLIAGWCEECLKEMVTFDVFWQYLKDVECVADFMFSCVWQSSVPNIVSDDLASVLELIFKAYASYEKRFRKTDFMKLCEDYVFEDYWTKENYAEWLNRKGIE